MPEHITGFQTEDGVKKYDYNALANLPELPSVGECANALMGCATGSTVEVNDVSPIKHIAKVRVFGKNLFDKNAVVNMAVGGGASNSYILTGNSYRGYYIECYEGEVYSISRTTTNCNRFRYGFTTEPPGDYVTMFGMSSTVNDTALKHENIVVPRGARYLFLYLSNQADEIDDVQIELNATATAYVPFADPTLSTVTEEMTGATYTPNADGSCDVVSVSPRMVLTTNASDFTIRCGYARDLNLVFSDFLRGARIADVTILANKWVGTASPYSQVVTVAGVTENTQVDLTPSVEQLAVFHNKDLAFVTENEGGVVTVYAVGEKPTNDYTIQATLTEVNV